MEEIYFNNEKIFDLVSEIIRKNGIDESLFDSALSLVEKRTSKSAELLNLTKQFVKTEISEKEFILLLQDKLKIPLSASKKIFQEINKKIIPNTQKITVKVEEERFPMQPKTQNLSEEPKQADAYREPIG